MRRREFITLAGSAAAWPLAARAQQAAKPMVGFLGTTTPDDFADRVAAFREGLKEVGYVEGQNVVIEYRWPEGHYDRLPTLASDLVRRQVAVIAAGGGEPTEIATEFVRMKVDIIVTHGTAAVIAAKQATSIIPIVFAVAADPVGAGLVASLARPGGNVTGLSIQQTDTAAKRLELLRQVIPNLQRLAIIANPGSPGSVSEMLEVQTAAKTLGLETSAIGIRRAEDIAPAFETAKGGADAVFIVIDPLLTAHRVGISILAVGARLPTISGQREFVDAGSLISYGPNFPDLFRRAGDFVNKILRGAKPADLPIEQPTKFDLIVNLTTAKALGLTIPQSLLAVADEVIE